MGNRKKISPFWLQGIVYSVLCIMLHYEIAFLCSREDHYTLPVRLFCISKDPFENLNIFFIAPKAFECLSFYIICLNDPFFSEHLD